MLHYILFCLLTSFAFSVQGMIKEEQLHQATVDAKGENLYYAVFQNKIALVEKLISEGANVNWKNKIGLTPLMRATTDGSAEMVELLLKAGANRTLKSGQGYTALEMAQEMDRQDIVKLLGGNKMVVAAPKATSRGAGQAQPIKITQEVKQTTPVQAAVNADVTGEKLYYAVFQNNIAEAKKLIGQGANVNWKNNKIGSTALIRAATEGKVEMVKLLLKAGADRTLKNNRGETALSWAQEMDRPDIIQLLNAA